MSGISDFPTTAYNLSLGPLEVGNALNLLLMGVLCVQAYQYYADFNKQDPLWIQSLMVFVIVMEIAQTALSVYIIWDFTVSHFGDVNYTLHGTRPMFANCFLAFPVAWVVQGFFAWRIYYLTNNRPFTLLIVILSFAQGLASMSTGIIALKATDESTFRVVRQILLLWFTCAVGADGSITVGMLYTLMRHKTGFKRTDDVIYKIMRGVVETGLATTVVVILDTLFFVGMPSTQLGMTSGFITGKIYANSVFFLLNGRSRYRPGNRLTDFATSFNDPIPHPGSGAVTNDRMSFRRSDSSQNSQFSQRGVEMQNISLPKAEPAIIHGDVKRRNLILDIDLPPQSPIFPDHKLPASLV